MTDDFRKNLPPIIYKYRDWDKPFHKKTLTHNLLYMAKQDELNDPLDALIPFRYKQSQMSSKNIRKKLFETAKSRWPKKSKKELDEIVNLRLTEVDFKSDDYWINMIPVFNQMVNNELGILSLATKWDSFSLWTHYGNSHKGFCLGFSTERLFQSINGLIGHVIYSDEHNEIDLFDKSLDGLAKAILQKSPDYSWESEIRITKIGMAGKSFIFPSDCLEEVVFGEKISEENKSDILRILRTLHPLIKVYQNKICPKTRKLIRERLYL